MIYEDSFSRITYNLWNRGGQVNFMFSNKSDKDITIDLENSFFILNGMANYIGTLYSKEYVQKNILKLTDDDIAQIELDNKADPVQLEPAMQPPPEEGQ